LAMAATLIACAEKPQQSASAARATSAVVARFETTVFAKADLLAGSPRPGRLSMRDYLREPFMNSLMNLEEVVPGSSGTVLLASESVLLGARDFRAPSGPPPNLGGVRSKRAVVFVLRPGKRLDLSAFDNFAERGPQGVLWRWPAHAQEGEPEAIYFHAALVGDAYFILANSRDDVEFMRRTLEGSAPRREGPPSIREWSTLSQTAAWSYRRYLHDPAEDRMAAGTLDVSDKAEALIMLPNLARDSVTLRLFSADTSADTVPRPNSWGPFPPWRGAGSGVWEAHVSFKYDETDMTSLLVMQWMLGFGLFI
jgi:hypothetical protein